MTKRCHFSGAKICPGRGIRFICSDSQKRRRTAKKPYSRSSMGATLEVIQKKKTERPEAQDGSREAAHFELRKRLRR
ncbi:hypothetical protein RDI58_017606 [Solanum bulbocastanum]|uniref:Large ribosomal subunit protein eL24-related N-terminal domain-containing protein n=1 Tax=Solanum bulbocastanum TaxID=147425 RepID=A0AAN8Y9C6_SOLBU